MRIGINALYLLPGAVGGTEIYLRQLLHWIPRLAPHHEFVLFLNQECADANLGDDGKIERVPTGVQATSRPQRLIYEQCRLPAIVKRNHVDVLFNPGFTAPAWCGCPMVTTFHDLQHKRHPEYFKALDLPAWNFFLALAARRSQRIIAISQATATDFRRFYPRVAAPIDITPLGAGDIYFQIAEDRLTSGNTDDVLLCVSTLHPHKNLGRLVRAFRAWRKSSGAETQLVIAGMRGFYASQLDAVIQECEATGFVRLTGWIAEEQLHHLYRTARAFVFPSLFEGFGIPPVEALACGLPTAVSDVEPMRTHVADAALRFNPTDEESIANAIGKLLTDEVLRAELHHRARKRAEQFRWQHTAQLTLHSLQAAVSGHHPVP